MKSMNSKISDLVNYYNIVHPQNLDWSLIQEQVLELRNDLGPGHELSVHEDYVLRYLSVLYEYYRNQSEIKIDFIMEGIDLGHVNTIAYAAALISFGVHGFSDRHQKILSGCEEILKLEQATAKHALFNTLVNDCDRGNYLAASDIISKHDFTDVNITATNARPCSFSFGNQAIAERVFSIAEWKSIASFLELHAESLKEQADTGVTINYSQCLSVANYKFYVVRYHDAAHVTIRLTGAYLLKKIISDEDELIEFRLLVDELKEFILDLESSASHTFSDPSLFLSNLSARATDG